MELQAEYRFGEIEARVDRDLLFIRARGTLALEVARPIMQLCAQLYQQHGSYYVLIDLNEGGGVPAALRRHVAEQLRSSPPTATAFYGGNLVTRASSALLIGAIQVLNGKDRRIASFPTEEKARDWLAAERQRAAATESE